MKTIYLDENYMCHTTYKEGYNEAQHEFFDSVCDNAIECYKYIPQYNFIQCVDSVRETAFQRQYHDDWNEAQKAYEEGVNNVE